MLHFAGVVLDGAVDVCRIVLHLLVLTIFLLLLIHLLLLLLVVLLVLLLLLALLVCTDIHVNVALCRGLHVGVLR